MLPVSDLRKISKARLRDAEVLLQGRRYDGAVYLSGYAVEVALKARICKTLRWAGFPETGKEFEAFKSFKTHDLGVLLTLSGIEAKVKSQLFGDWSYVENWRPENRYNRVRTSKSNDARTMIASVRNLLAAI